MFILETNDNAKTNRLDVFHVCKLFHWLMNGGESSVCCKIHKFACTLGNCFCEVGFGGSDCSFDISSPPVIWKSTPSGTCDKSLHQCSRIYFNGRYFLENVNKNCFITKQFVSFSWGVMYCCLFSKCIFPTFIKISYLPYIFLKIDVTKNLNALLFTIV